MFSLINGKPIFYIGKINDIGYTSEAEKDLLIQKLKQDNSEVEIIDEKIEIDEEVREKAEDLAQLKLTFSKVEFMQYLHGEKTHHLIKMKELEEENRLLNLKNNALEGKLMSAEQQNKITLMGLMDVNSKLRALQKEVK